MLKPQVTQIGHNTATSHHFGTPGLLLSKDDDDKQLRLFASEKIEEEKSITVLVASNARREVQLVAGLEPSSERNHGGHYGTQSSPDQKKTAPVLAISIFHLPFIIFPCFPFREANVLPSRQRHRGIFYSMEMWATSTVITTTPLAGRIDEASNETAKSGWVTSSGPLRHREHSRHSPSRPHTPNTSPEDPYMHLCTA